MATNAGRGWCGLQHVGCEMTLPLTLTPRPDGCYRWVVAIPGGDPEIAHWTGEDWNLGNWSHCLRVYKVGVGGIVYAPPTEWEDDLP